MNIYQDDSGYPRVSRYPIEESIKSIVASPTFPPNQYSRPKATTPVCQMPANIAKASAKREELRSCLLGHVQAMYQAPTLHNPERHRTLTIWKTLRIDSSNTSWLTNFD